jgi:purine-binding chemotaxis protein CheW
MQACLRFRLGSEWYAVPVGQVVEVVSLVAITPLPQSPPHVLGAITVRGQAITVLDLRHLLGYTLAPLKLTTPMIILRPEHGAAFAALVDEVEGVIEVRDDLELTANSGGMLAGITRYQEAVILVVCVDALASTSIIRDASRKLASRESTILTG